jgi:hypothetical protein
MQTFDLLEKIRVLFFEPSITLKGDGQKKAK